MADEERASNPGTEPFKPDFDDTGTHSFVPDFSDDEDADSSDGSSDGEESVPFVPNWDDTDSQPVPQVTEPKPSEEEPEVPAPAAGQDTSTEPSGAPVQSVTVPGRYLYLKWWKLALVVLGVWAVAAEVGLSLFYWWYHTGDKTLAAYAALVYVVVCVVAAVMLAMVQGRPWVSALSLGVMSGPFASVAAAAPLYGYYLCARVGHCLAGVLPY